MTYHTNHLLQFNKSWSISSDRLLSILNPKSDNLLFEMISLSVSVSIELLRKLICGLNPKTTSDRSAIRTAKDCNVIATPEDRFTISPSKTLEFKEELTTEHILQIGIKSLCKN